MPTISEEARQAIKQQPNRDEILKAIEHLNNNSAPGIDGVTSRLVKFLATLIPDILCTAITKEMNGRDGKTLMTRIHKLILIEKRDSEKKTIKKLRPISLLAAFYKVISNIISTRIRGVFIMERILPASKNVYVPEDQVVTLSLPLTVF